MRYRFFNVPTVLRYHQFLNPPQQPTSQPQGSSAQLLALEKALDIRKFEIDLYWKRATYFWAFIAATFAGYFLVLSSEKLPDPQKHEALLVLTCIGLVFSFGWFLANKGSKFWQENWEKHVDMLEDGVIGPLHKTTIDNRFYNPCSITGFYQYSVSKINQILSLFVAVIWLFLGAREVSTTFGLVEPFTWFNEIVIVILAIATLAILFFGARGGRANRRFYFRRREVVD